MSLLHWDILTVLKMCENCLALIVLSHVANSSDLVFQEGIKQTIRTDFIEARSVLSHVSVQCVCVCVCVCVYAWMCVRAPCSY